MTLVKTISVEEQPKRNLARKAKYFFCTINKETRDVTDLSYKDFVKSDATLETPGAHTQTETLKALLSQIKRFADKVEYNQWCKASERSYFDKVERLLEMGAKWTKRGLLC